MAPDTDDTFEPGRRAADAARDAARDASTAARHATRSARHAAQRARWGARCDRTPWFFGSLMIGLGLLFLLDNLDIIEARYVFRNLWPLIIVFFGLSRLLFGQGGERVFGALATAFGGLWLADRLLDWDVNVIGVFWPLILIGLGISMMFRPRHRWGGRPQPPAPPIPPSPPLPGAPQPPYVGVADATTATESNARADDVDQSARLKEVAILANVERRNVSQVFRGGEITAIMGSVEIDMRDCRMADPTTTIVVQVVMGQVALRLPSNWTVESHLGTFLGNLEDRSDRPVDTNPRRLILYGSAFMGQVEIRN